MAGLNHEAVKVHGDKGTFEEWNADHKQKGHHDCEQFQHQNHVLENRTTYPGGPVPGQIIFRSDFPNAFVWTGTMWASLTPVATIVVAADGTGNFTTIQEGIDALPGGGGVVYIKEGTYMITAPIAITSNHVTLIGSGTSTKIQTVSNITMFNITGDEGIHLNKIFIYGDISKAANVGIYMNDTIGMTIRDCRIEHCGSHGISASLGRYNLFSGNVVVLNKGDGIKLDGTADGGGVYTIAECLIGSNDGSGIYADDITQIIISDTEVSDNKNFGVYAANSHSLTLKGGNVLVNYWDGVHLLNYSNSIISNCSIGLNDSQNTGTFSGVKLVSSDDNNISDNVIWWNDNFGIDISNAACEDNIVMGNRCRGNTAGGVNDQGTDTLPNGAVGTHNLELDDLNILA